MGQAREDLANHAPFYAEQVGQLHFLELGPGRQAMIEYRLLDLAQYLVFAEFDLIVFFELR